MTKDVFVAIFILTGSALAFTAAIGLLRFPDTLTRMHATTKPQTLGLVLVMVGAIIELNDNIDVGMLVLTALFAFITAPVVGHRLGRVAYQEQRHLDSLISEDELEKPDSD